MRKVLASFNFKKLAIACSGGVDSMCLALLASQETQIVALIVDHCLRPEAVAEAAQASAILNKIGIENHILKITTKIDKNAQENARNERYKILAKWCKKNGYDALATAHHADDNAENFLLRLVRGSGVDGLAGITAETEIYGQKIIRPLLRFSKAELMQMLEKAGIEWVEDASNASDKYARNRLRHALEQLEEKDLLTQRINAVSKNLARVQSFLHAETAKAEESCVAKNQIEQAEFAKLHPEIALRLLQAVIAKNAATSKKPRFEKLQNLYCAILAGKKATLSGLIFVPKKTKIIIELEK